MTILTELLFTTFSIAEHPVTGTQAEHSDFICSYIWIFTPRHPPSTYPSSFATPLGPQPTPLHSPLATPLTYSSFVSSSKHPQPTPLSYPYSEPQNSLLLTPTPLKTTLVPLSPAVLEEMYLICN